MGGHKAVMCVKVKDAGAQKSLPEFLPAQFERETEVKRCKKKSKRLNVVTGLHAASDCSLFPKVFVTSWHNRKEKKKQKGIQSPIFSGPSSALCF